MIETYDGVLKILKSVLWEESAPVFSDDDWFAIFDELKKHAVASLAGGKIGSWNVPAKIKQDWKTHIYQQVYHYQVLLHAQSVILSEYSKLGVCAVVLKGTSAAQYYPQPEYRTMGDIDLLVKPEQYDQACNILQQIGYIAESKDEDASNTRHGIYYQNGITVELHRKFASVGTPQEVATLDSYLLENMRQGRFVPSPVLTGLVLLEHIAQHLQEGIGLRQVIDWMMYVNHNLSDSLWNDQFCSKARSIGLETLAITITRMCQLYLGLTSDGILWCCDADEKLCATLMDYIIESGNFGRSRDILSSGAVSRMPSFTHPVLLFKYLQNHGERNWLALEKHPKLRMFAWLYQTKKLVKIAIKNHVNQKKMRELYYEGKRRRRMFEQVGVYYK